MVGKIKKLIPTSIRKNFKTRLNWACIIGVVWLLGDEYLKEGYLFNPADVTRPLTHESLIAMIVILMLLNSSQNKIKEVIKKFWGGEDAEE